MTQRWYPTDPGWLRRRGAGALRAVVDVTMYDARMGTDTAALLKQVLALPEDEREELATEALASLYEPAGDDLTDEWIDEIERRIEQVESGAVVCGEWDVVEKRLLVQFPKA